MGIYNPNATMPKNCAVCKEDCRYRNITAHKRHKRCPLVEIKSPHGRLGDLDFSASLLREDAKEYSEIDEIGIHSDKWCGYMECIKTLEGVPAVIEAEEESSIDIDEEKSCSTCGYPPLTPSCITCEDYSNWSPVDHRGEATEMVEPRSKNDCETCGTPRHLCKYCIEEDSMWTPKDKPQVGKRFDIVRESDHITEKTEITKKFADKSQDETWICPRCGRQVVNSTYCKMCGCRDESQVERGIDD